MDNEETRKERINFVREYINKQAPQKIIKTVATNYLESIKQKENPSYEESKLLENYSQNVSDKENEQIYKEAAEKAYFELLSHVKKVADSLSDPRGGEAGYSQLMKLKPVLKEHDLLQGPYEEFYNKLEMAQKDGHFGRLNEQWNELEKIVKSM